MVDAREFVRDRFTGIARVLEGLLDALAEKCPPVEIVLAVQDPRAVPPRLGNRKNIAIRTIPPTFLRSEKANLAFGKRKEFLLYTKFVD